MKTLTLSFKKKSMHSLYLFLKTIVDLSESIYLKLNYFKSNYKKAFISIFDEKDRSTLISSPNKSFKNEYLQRFLDWAGSLFGSVEESFNAIKVKALGHLDTYIKDLQNSKSSTVAIINTTSVISLCLIFLIFYQFT